MRKIGLNQVAFKDVTVDEFALLLKQNGFETTFSGIKNSDAEMADTAAAFAKHGIVYETLHAPFSHINDIWYDTDDGVQMMNELKTAVDRCVIAGAPILVVHLSSGLTPPPPTDIGRGRFIDLVDYAKGKNIKIAFENQRMLGNISWAFEQFREDNVGFCWDCGHEYCFTPGRRYMPLFGDRLICTHIQDNTCEFDIDRHLIPFDGNIPFDIVAKQIKDSGYKGSLMLEVFPRFAPPKYDSYQDNTAKMFVERAANAAKKLRDMIDN